MPKPDNAVFQDHGVGLAAAYLGLFARECSLANYTLIALLKRQVPPCEQVVVISIDETERPGTSPTRYVQCSRHECVGRYSND